MPKFAPTIYALKLAEALKHRGIHSDVEHWDGHKHIDVYVKDPGINIELDGLQHYTNPTQIIADFHRNYFSDQEKHYTLRIPNELIETHLDEIADAIKKVAHSKINI